MGNNTANDLTGLSEYGIDISLEQQIAIQLQSNHYPPIPLTMVQPCIEAINAYNEDNGSLEIELPEGVLYKNGKTTAPAWAIIEQHHLSAWCDQDDYIDDEWLDDDEDLVTHPDSVPDYVAQLFTLSEKMYDDGVEGWALEVRSIANCLAEGLKL